MLSSGVSSTNKRSFESAAEQEINPSDYLKGSLEEILKKANQSKSGVQKRNPEGELMKLIRKWRRENRMRYLNNEILMAAYQNALNA